MYASLLVLDYCVTNFICPGDMDHLFHCLYASKFSFIRYCVGKNPTILQDHLQHSKSILCWDCKTFSWNPVSNEKKIWIAEKDFSALCCLL